MKRRTRLAAYVVAITDDRLLLVRIAESYPGAGRWTLPGGGVEFGEHPEEALAREVYEESGLTLASLRYLGIDSRVYAASDAGELHAIRMIFASPLSGRPQVTEIDGSVDAARWIPINEIEEVDTVDLVGSALGFAGTA